MSDMTPGSRDPMDNRLGVSPETGPILNDDDLDPGREDVARINEDWNRERTAQAGEADDDEVAEEQRIAQRLASGITSPDQGGSTS